MQFSIFETVFRSNIGCQNNVLDAQVRQPFWSPSKNDRKNTGGADYSEKHRTTHILNIHQTTISSVRFGRFFFIFIFICFIGAVSPLSKKEIKLK